MIQRAVDRIIFAGLHLDGHHRQSIIIINEIIHFPSLLVVIIEQPEPVRLQLAGRQRLIDRAQIHAVHIFQHGLDIVLIKDARQDAYIIQI